MTYEHRLIGAPDETLHPAYSRAQIDESLLKLENSVALKYLNDAVFHCQVHVGAGIIQDLIPNVKWHDAKRAALLVIAASQQEML